MTDMTTPGAGEGERWESEQQVNGMWWRVATYTPTFRIVAPDLLKADADLIVKLHNAHEANQQAIADLRDALDDAKKSWAHWREDSEHHNQLATTYFKNWQDSLQTIAELRKALDNAVEYVEPCDKDEGRDYCMTHHEFQCPAAGFVTEARKALAAIAAEEKA